MAISVTFKGTTYSVPTSAGESGWETTLSTFLQALASGAGVNSIAKQTVRVATTTPVTVQAATDYAVVCKLTSPGVVAVALPAGATGQLFAIVDGTGDAGTNAITITGNGGQTINGAASYVINENFGGVLLAWNGTQWNLLSDFVGADPKFTSVTVSGTATVGALAATSATVGGVAVVTTTAAQALQNKTLDDTDNAVLVGGNSRGAAMSVGTSDAFEMTLRANAIGKAIIATTASAATSGDLRAANSVAGWSIPAGSTAQRPSAPAAGLVRYNSDTSSFEGYGSAWSPLGGGSSSGVNVVPSASQNGSSGWGTSNATVATDTSASNNPLAGVTTSALSLVSSTSGGYARLQWTMPAGLQNRPLNIDFWAKLAAASDYRVELYCNAASNYGGAYTRVILNSDVSSVSNLNGGSTQFRTFFVEQGQSFYELRLVRTAASSATAYFSNIAVGVQPQVGNGFAGTNWQSFTPGITGLPVSSISGLWLQDGQNAYYQIYGVASGAATTTIQVGLPTGQSIDAVFNIPAGTEGANFGTVKAVKSGVGYHQGTVTRGDSVTSLRLLDDDGTGSPYNATVPFTWSSGDNFSILAGPIAITGWSSSVTVADRAVEEFASNSSTGDGSNTTSFAYGPNGSPIAAIINTSDKRVRFNSPIQATDSLAVEINFAGTNQWIPLESSIIGGANTATQGIVVYRTSGSSTDCDVRFGSAGHSATPASNANAWTILSSTLWRVRKVSGGASVGYPIGTRNIVGDVSGTAVPAGMIGETVTSNPANFSQASPVLNTSYTIGTLSIPSAGQWLVEFFTAQNLNATGAAQFAQVDLASSGGTTVYATPCVLSPGQASGDAFVGGTAKILVRTTGAVTITASTKHSNFRTGAPGTPTSIGAYANNFVATRIA